MQNLARAQFSNPRRQRGIGMVTVFLMISVFLFLGVFAIKIVPEYMENWTVRSIAQSAVDEPEVLKQTKTIIYNHLNTAYRQHSLWDLRAEDTIVLEKLGRNKGYAMKVQYEKRTNFMHNIFLVTAFDYTPEVSN